MDRRFSCQICGWTLAGRASTEVERTLMCRTRTKRKIVAGGKIPYRGRLGRSESRLAMNWFNRAGSASNRSKADLKTIQRGKPLFS